jgi:hypothetical protein
MSVDNESSVPGHVHWSFWLIGVVTLLWHAGGLANFVIQMMNADMLESYQESERALIEGRPLWATIAFATSVIGGVLGSLLLLFKRSAAIYVFILSLIATIGTMAHALTAGIDFSAAEMAGIIAMPIVLPALLIYYCRTASARGWLK